MVLITYDVNTEDASGRKRLRQTPKQCVNYGSIKVSTAKNEAVAMGIRDGVQFGPFLILNGVELNALNINPAGGKHCCVAYSVLTNLTSCSKYGLSNSDCSTCRHDSSILTCMMIVV